MSAATDTQVRVRPAVGHPAAGHPAQRQPDGHRSPVHGHGHRHRHPAAHGRRPRDGKSARSTDLQQLHQGSPRSKTSCRRSSTKVRSGERVSFGSYFNAFPASYWRRWTTVREGPPVRCAPGRRDPSSSTSPTPADRCSASTRGASTAYGGEHLRAVPGALRRRRLVLVRPRGRLRTAGDGRRRVAGPPRLTARPGRSPCRSRR